MADSGTHICEEIDAIERSLKAQCTTWELELMDEEEGFFITADVDEVIASGIKSEKNANLIAAAPELLESLEELKKGFIKIVRSMYGDTVSFDFTKTDAAIAKAKGE